MDTGYTVVIDDQQALSLLCGTNDTNLRTIEDYLGVPIISKGNEVTIASDNSDACRKFNHLMTTLLETPLPKVSLESKLSALILDMKHNEVSNISVKNKIIDSYIQIPHTTEIVYPKTVKQAELICALQTHDIVFCSGPAGTGKTFLVIAEALKLVLSRQIKKIIISRPVVEAGENLGFLPGDLEQKIDPYLRPLYDAIESLLPQEIYKKLLDSKMIEAAPLAYMRGRSLKNALLILDEAQNTTPMQMKMFLTRMGEGSRIFITGDPSQVDLPIKAGSGLSHAISLLSNIDDIAIVTLDEKDIVRNPLVQKIVKAYEQQNI